MAATGTLTWLETAARLSAYERSRIELFAHAEALTEPAQFELERLAFNYVRLALLEEAGTIRERETRAMVEDEMAPLLAQMAERMVQP